MKVTSYHQLCCTIKARSTRWIWKSYQHNKINHSCWWDLQFLHQNWLPFKWGEETRYPPPRIVTSFYRTPKNKEDQAEQSTREVEEIVFQNKNSPFWLTGDLTLLLLIVHAPHVGTNRCKSIIHFYCGLQQAVDFATRNDATLELFFTNRPTL